MDSFHVKDKFSLDGKKYTFWSLPKAQERFPQLASFPVSALILLENMLRHEDNTTTHEMIENFITKNGATVNMTLHPERVLLQDFTGVPVFVDLASLRDTLMEKGGDGQNINPVIPVDLVIDHSLTADFSGGNHALASNMKREYERNQERYHFLKWGARAFKNFRLIPPGFGICHQVNLEYLSTVVRHEQDSRENVLFFDTLVGADSHTTMVNGLSVLGWGVGGIEAEAVLLGQPLFMRKPLFVGVELVGRLKNGICGTDIVLTITQTLRKHGVVGKCVEFFGQSINLLTLENRATIANMAPEYGATCGFFPPDEETIRYLKDTGRPQKYIARVRAYLEKQEIFGQRSGIKYDETLIINLNTIETCLAGPSRPQDLCLLNDVSKNFQHFAQKIPLLVSPSLPKNNKACSVKEGDVVIAAITSCTNTSNPDVMIGAALLARNALDRGLSKQPWVKTSLAPGSVVVTKYLEKLNLQQYFDHLGFHTVGYGCTTCIGNSGPLLHDVEKDVSQSDINVVAILSGNRNFEGRIHPRVRASYLASPMLVVAYALAGSVLKNLREDPLGKGNNGKPVFLDDIWPEQHQIAEQRRIINKNLFTHAYTKEAFSSPKAWQEMKTVDGANYPWEKKSLYIRRPDFGGLLTRQDVNTQKYVIEGARVLALLGDSITTDHISPAGSINQDTPAAIYLKEHGISPSNYHSYGARRGNHEVMARGTFANIRLHNHMSPEKEGGFTRHYPSGEHLPIYDAAERYRREQIPLVVIAGEQYGTGSSRDWAAKGPRLLGVVAVIASSYERIHRSNLVGMGIVPLQWEEGTTWHTLKFTGKEILDIRWVYHEDKQKHEAQCVINRENGKQEICALLVRIDTPHEQMYYTKGGLLPFFEERFLACRSIKT